MKTKTSSGFQKGKSQSSRKGSSGSLGTSSKSTVRAGKKAYSPNTQAGQFTKDGSKAITAKIAAVLHGERPREIADGAAFLEFLRSSPEKDFIEPLDFGTTDFKD